MIGCEMIRLFMKAHSYLRNKLYYATGPNKYLQYIPACYQSNPSQCNVNRPIITMGSFIVELKRYLYFSFAPTLLYRDSYPRSGRRNFSLIISHSINFTLCIYFAFIMYRQFITGQSAIFMQTSLNTIDFLNMIFKTIMPAVVWMFLLFFALIHSW